MLDRNAKPVELGVFLPVGNGGWITSTTSPQLAATYDYNKQVTLLAEDLGFDFWPSTGGLGVRGAVEAQFTDRES